MFTENKRDVVVLETSNFGRAVEVEVGALVVGQICQVHRSPACFDRGDEKGYFSFGGSTIVLLFEKDTHTQIDQGLDVLLVYQVNP